MATKGDGTSEMAKYNKIDAELKILRHAMAACRELVAESSQARKDMITAKIKMDVQAYDSHLAMNYQAGIGQQDFLGAQI